MTEYRVITNGYRFRIEYKVPTFFNIFTPGYKWVLYQVGDGHVSLDPWEGTSEYQADMYIEKLTTNEKNSSGTWGVV